ncbi:hypothetical protein GJ744_010110 [Endocarpon pusillum]|uniref:Kinesin light chain n=1 Tax=Endocarpon pusillum TaxID=364733 RepID=A0A8H7AGS2_9EURO|nr:hypothetical protein GJ744_010110 [Endocarpon pusillum]
MGVYDLAARNLVNHVKAKETVALLQGMVQIRVQSLAEDHPDRLASQHALAGAYEANGQMKEAATLLQAMMRVREHSLAEDHPSRLMVSGVSLTGTTAVFGLDDMPSYRILSYTWELAYESDVEERDAQPENMGRTTCNDCLIRISIKLHDALCYLNISGISRWL